MDFDLHFRINIATRQINVFTHNCYGRHNTSKTLIYYGLSTLNNLEVNLCSCTDLVCTCVRIFELSSRTMAVLKI